MKRTTRPPQTVIFDFGNVIARIDNAYFLSLLTGWPKEACTGKVQEIFCGTSLSRDFETGVSGLEEFQRGVEKILGVSHTSAAFGEAYCAMFQPIPETLDLIRRLKTDGVCRLGLLSNTNPLHFDQVFQKLPIAGCFDQLTVSYQVGAMKPDPRIFKDAAGKAGCDPHDILFLDDLPPFVAAAHACGWQAWLYDDPPVIASKVYSLFV